MQRGKVFLHQRFSKERYKILMEGSLRYANTELLPDVKIDGALILDCSVLQAILAAQPPILNYTIAHTILNLCNVVRFPRANDFSLMLHYYKANSPKVLVHADVGDRFAEQNGGSFGGLLYNKIRVVNSE